MGKLDKMEALKTKQFFDLDNVSIVATFDHLLRERSADRKDANCAIFSDITSRTGKSLSMVGKCNFGLVMNKLNPRKGERFVFKDCRNCYGTVGEHVRFCFPKEIIGVNNEKKLRYSFKTKRLEKI